MCSWYNIEFWDDYENKLDKEKVGLASKTNQDTIKIFVFGLNRSRLNSIVKYTTFIESIFMIGLHYTRVDSDKYKKLRVYFGDDSEDNLVNEFIIEKFVPYFRRGSLPLLYYEDYIEKGEEELKKEKEIAKKFKEIKENLRKEEIMKRFGTEIGQSTALMACWNDKDGKLIKVPMILNRLDEGSIMNVGLKEEEGSEEMKPLDDNDKSEVLKFLEENKKDLQEMFKVPEEYTIKYYQDE